MYPKHSQTIEIQTGYIDSLVILIHFPYPINIVITRPYCTSNIGYLVIFTILKSKRIDIFVHKKNTMTCHGIPLSYYTPSPTPFPGDPTRGPLLGYLETAKRVSAGGTSNKQKHM
jgi:hypothetical protein